MCCFRASKFAPEGQFSSSYSCTKRSTATIFLSPPEGGLDLVTNRQGHHFSHSIIQITAMSSFIPSSTTCPVGAVSTVDERRQCSIIVYDDLLLNALLIERASKQYDHAHTSHRSTSSVGLAGAGGEFPVTRAATELIHDLRRKKIHYDFPCFEASFVSLFILVGLGSQLLGE